MKLNKRNRRIQSAIQHTLKTGLPVIGIFLSVVCSADLAPLHRPPDKRPVVNNAKPGERVHIVRHGETLSGIAVRYGVSQRAILKLNGLPPSRADHLRVGQRLRIPARPSKPTPPPPQPHPQPQPRPDHPNGLHTPPPPVGTGPAPHGAQEPDRHHEAGRSPVTPPGMRPLP